MFSALFLVISIVFPDISNGNVNITCAVFFYQRQELIINQIRELIRIIMIRKMIMPWLLAEL